MSSQRYKFFIELTYDQMINMIFLGGNVEFPNLASESGENHRLQINGCHKHFFTGTSGVEDGSTHNCVSHAIFDESPATAVLNVQSCDGGETYTGIVELEVFSRDNMSEGG